MNLGMIKLKLTFVLIVTAGLVYAQSQDSTDVVKKRILSLDECISIAIENNIDMERSRNNALIAKSNQFQSIMNFLPTLNGSATFTRFYSSTFDAVAGKFVDQADGASPSLDASLTLFGGMNNHYLKNQAKFRLESAQNGIVAQKQSLHSSVLGSYLSVVLDKENIKISQGRVDLLKAQLEREERRNSVGVGNLDQVYNFQSQLANENLRKVNLENTLKRDKLQLLQTLQIEVSRNFEIAPYDFTGDENLQNIDRYSDVYSASMSYSPSIKQAEADAISSKYRFKSGQASLMPTVTAFARYGSRYSSVAAENIGTVDNPNIVPISALDQISDGQLQWVGVRLSVPIFNGYQARNNVQVAKLNFENANLNLKQAELDMTNTIQSVYLDLISAQETYQAAQDNLVALNQSFIYVKTRYEHGNTDFYTYLESLNNKNRAEVELVNAKYSIVFRKKILDVYRGLL